MTPVGQRYAGGNGGAENDQGDHFLREGPRCTQQAADPALGDSGWWATFRFDSKPIPNGVQTFGALFLIRDFDCAASADILLGSPRQAFVLIMALHRWGVSGLFGLCGQLFL